MLPDDRWPRITGHMTLQDQRMAENDAPIVYGHIQLGPSVTQSRTMPLEIDKTNG